MARSGSRRCLPAKSSTSSSSADVVLAHVVVVDGSLDQSAGVDERVDGRGRGVGAAEQRLAVDLVHDLPVDLDRGVGPDDLQVEDESAGLDCVDHVAQDVHDVLRVDASERPGEDDEVERLWFELDLPARGDAVRDAFGKLDR